MISYSYNRLSVPTSNPENGRLRSAGSLSWEWGAVGVPEEGGVCGGTQGLLAGGSGLLTGHVA